MLKPTKGSRKIERKIAFINELLTQNEEIDLKKIVIHSATESIDKDGRIIKRPRYSDIQKKENAIDVIIGNVYNYRLSGCSFLIPKDAFDAVGEI